MEDEPSWMMKNSLLLDPSVIPMLGSLSASGGFVPTVMRIAEVWPFLPLLLGAPVAALDGQIRSQIEW